MLFNPFSDLDDLELEESLQNKARIERDANADIILHLVVLRERRLYVGAGYDSLFSYCTQKLGFSRSTAYRRKAIAEKAECFPSLIDRLRDGRLHLCAAAAIAPHLDEGSAEILMDDVKGLSHREVEAYLIKNWRRKETPPSSAPAAAAGAIVDSSIATPPPPPPGAPTPFVSAANRTIIRPVAPDSNRVNVTMSDKTLERLTRAKEILRGKSDDEILQRALDVLLDKIAPERRHARREARKEKKASSKATAKCGTKTEISVATRQTRRGTQADRDQAMVEGGLQCAYTSPDGVRCTTRCFLEIDHIQPWALGGPSERDNYQPMCTPHNQWRAEQTFGPWVPKDSGPNSSIEKADG